MATLSVEECDWSYKNVSLKRRSLDHVHNRKDLKPLHDKVTKLFLAVVKIQNALFN